MENERWLPVVGNPKYEISDLGRVRSLIGTPKLKNPTRDRGGYLRVNLSYEGGDRKLRLVHHLVLEAFVGPRPEGQETRHLNGDRTKNKLTNICWGTKEEQMADRKLHGRVVGGPVRVRLNPRLVQAIRNDTRPPNRIAKDIGCSHSSVRSVKHRQTWAWVVDDPSVPPVGEPDQEYGVSPRGESSPQSRLTDQEIADIRADPRRNRDIAAAYGISKGHISNIKHGRKR